MSGKQEIEVGDVVRAGLYFVGMAGCIWFTLQISGAYYWFPWQWGWWPW